MKNACLCEIKVCHDFFPPQSTFNMGFLEASVYWAKGWQEVRAGRNLMLSKFSFLGLNRRDLHARGSKAFLKNPFQLAHSCLCFHGWNSINSRLSYRKDLNKIRSQMDTSCLMSLAGIFGMKFVLNVSMWQSHTSLGVWRIVSRNSKDHIVFANNPVCPGWKHLALGDIVVTHYSSPTQITIGLLQSLCMDCNEHPWKDKHLDFLPMRWRILTIKEKWINSPFKLFGPKKSTLPFLTRTYSSVGFCWKTKQNKKEHRYWYHGLIVMCIIFYPSKFLEGRTATSLRETKRKNRYRTVTYIWISYRVIIII